MPMSASPNTWRPALVAVDVFLGPYPALVPADQDPAARLTPRFELNVARRMHDAVERLAADGSRRVRVIDGRVYQTTITGGHGTPSEVITADADGLYAIEAPIGQWTTVDIRWTRTDECECGTCACPASCAACDQPVGGGHAGWCPWPAGSAPWERPAISSVDAVLDVHRHQPGCPLVRRRPGPLFPADRHRCAFCGAAGTRQTHNLTVGGTVSHHERCRECRQVWIVAAAQPAC